MLQERKISPIAIILSSFFAHLSAGANYMVDDHKFLLSPSNSDVSRLQAPHGGSPQIGIRG